MRLHLYVLPLALCAAPLGAQQGAAPQQEQPREQSQIKLPAAAQQQGQRAPARPQRPIEATQIPPELSDPRMADRLTDAMIAMSGAFLELPVGEVEAAMEGRKPTAADRQRTVRSESAMSEQQLRQQLEASRPMMQASLKALVTALPSMMKGMGEAQRELERSTANVPRPDYPKR